MDNSMVRTAAELERKYNLSRLAKNAANIETNSKEIIHIQKELDDMYKSIVLNLGDTLQESVSLWFYEGIPTTSNEPYTDWLIPSEHYDDLYYDQLSGNVYKFTADGWIQQTDTNLVSSMALTNVELDVSTDHERKVYLSQPTPPYSSGDWWIQEDGTLYICQLGKPSGDYEENDFVTSSLYTPTIATKQEGTITILHGQYTEVVEGQQSIRQTIADQQTLIDANGESIGTLTTSFQTFMDATGINFNAINTQLENGVEKLVNGLVRIDANGINTSRTGETFNTQITNRTFEVKDGTKELAFIGYDSSTNKTIARIPELESIKITAGNHRCEAITENGEDMTAWYFVGGNS